MTPNRRRSDRHRIIRSICGLAVIGLAIFLLVSANAKEHHDLFYGALFAIGGFLIDEQLFADFAKAAAAFLPWKNNPPAGN